MGGRQLDVAEADTLLRDRQLGPLDGFRSRLGRPFTAALRLNDAHEVTFDFGDGGSDDSAAPPDFTGLEPFDNGRGAVNVLAAAIGRRGRSRRTGLPWGVGCGVGGGTARRLRGAGWGPGNSSASRRRGAREISLLTAAARCENVPKSS